MNEVTDQHTITTFDSFIHSLTQNSEAL